MRGATGDAGGFGRGNWPGEEVGTVAVLVFLPGSVDRGGGRCDAAAQPGTKISPVDFTSWELQ